LYSVFNPSYLEEKTMNNTLKLTTLWARVVLLALFASSLVFTPAHADVAPPEAPPGTNIVPGTDTTQVRMLAEMVTLTILPQSAEGRLGQAKTEASFLMRNLGAAAENIEVRFPLTFFNGSDNGFGQFPEIDDIQITVNGKPAYRKRLFLRRGYHQSIALGGFYCELPSGPGCADQRQVHRKRFWL
jgi:hypothetical protein